MLRSRLCLRSAYFELVTASELRAGFGITSGKHFDSGQMDVNTLAFDVVVGDLKCVRPRYERVIGAERADAVVALRVIGREREIVRVELHRLAIQRE